MGKLATDPGSRLKSVQEEGSSKGDNGLDLHTSREVMLGNVRGVTSQGSSD